MAELIAMLIRNEFITGENVVIDGDMAYEDRIGFLAHVYLFSRKLLKAHGAFWQLVTT